MSTILLAEDTEELRELLQGALEKKGFKVIIAKNGMEALRIFKNNMPNIDGVVTDLEMPMMNGIQLVKEIRSLDSTIPIVMWSGSQNPKLPKLNLFLSKSDGSKGVVDFLLKEAA